MNPDLSGKRKTVFFEPWSLGDVVIAVSTLRELPYPAALACHPAWHQILRAALPDVHSLDLIPVELPYTTRKRSHALDLNSKGQPNRASPFIVLSIRGDLRDYFAARRLFPHARIKMTGWARFLARKNSLVDLPYRLGLFAIENRYVSWAKVAGIPFQQIETSYRSSQSSAPRSNIVVIHTGAQWRSKQYPHVARLGQLLRMAGRQIIIAAASADIPPEVAPEKVVIAENESLVRLFRSAEHVITNDSGPMHLAALLGCRTTVIARAASIEEWLPPATQVVSSVLTPKGYRQRREYMTDRVLEGWPDAATVAAAITDR
jgi:ADP-heptose:LPS heptosyltransferase